MTEERAPLTPPECDLRDYRSMMLDIPRLRGSEFDATPDDAAWRAGLNLWMSAFHSVPAASLDDSEPGLCKAAGLGRDLKTWRKVKPAAMRGWVMCADGRWYHLVLAEVALEAWLGKLAQQMSSGAGNAKRWGTVFDPARVIASIRRSAAMLRALAPESGALKKVARHLSGTNPDGKEEQSRPDNQTVPLGSQVEGEEKEKEKKEETHPPGGGLFGVDEIPEAREAPGAFDQFWKAFDVSKHCKNAKKPDARKAWDATEKIRPPLEDLLRAVAGYLAWVAEKSKKEKRDYPVQHPSTWLRGEVWANFLATGQAPAAVHLHPSWGEQRVMQWRAVLSEPVFNAWFAEAEFVEGDPPIIRFTKPFQRNYVANHFPRQIQQLVKGEFQLDVRQRAA